MQTTKDQLKKLESVVDELENEIQKVRDSLGTNQDLAQGYSIQDQL